MPSKSLVVGRPRGTSDHLPAREATETEIAWAAGIFEGEGTIVLNRDGSLRFQIGMTDEDVLDRLRDILGGRVYGPYQYDSKDDWHRKPQWRWSIQTANDFERVARMLAPWLCARRSARLRELIAASHWDIDLNQEGG